MKYATPCPSSRRSAMIEGMPSADQIPARFHQRAGVNRLKFVDLTGTRQATKRFSRVATRAVGMLMQHGVHLGRVIAKGRYAEVSEIDGDPGVVVKISGDVTEASAWTYILEMVQRGELSWDDVPALPRVRCAYQVPARTKSERPLYVIFVERCHPLSRSEKRMVEALDTIMLEGRVGLRPGIRAPYTVERQVKDLARRYPSISRAPEHAVRMIETLQALAGHSLFIYDIHAENVMKSTKGESGQWKITDLGMTETCCPVSIPILELP